MQKEVIFMHVRWLDRRDWDNVREKRYTARSTVTRYGVGMEAYFIIDRLDHRVVVPGPEGDMVISDEGYSWYQLALRDKKVWLSAAFDSAGGLIELYFDITAGNDFSEPECPRFRDMYLDVTLSPGGVMRVLDRDELDEALARGDVTPEEHRETVRVGAELTELLRSRGGEMIGEVIKRAAEMRGIVEEKSSCNISEI